MIERLVNLLKRDEARFEEEGEEHTVTAPVEIELDEDDQIVEV